MEITEVGVRIVERSEDRLKAVCTMTLDDCFVVRDIKVVEGQHGLFVAMPSRKRTGRCPQCSHKNEIRSRFCGECGAKQPPAPNPRPQNGDKTTSHTDIAHPINTECREMIQEVILEAYQEELAEYLAEQQQDGMPTESCCAEACACSEHGAGESGHAASGIDHAEDDDRMEPPMMEVEAVRAAVKPPRQEPSRPRQDDLPPRPPRDRGGEGSRETRPASGSNERSRQDSRPPRGEPQAPSIKPAPAREPVRTAAPCPQPVGEPADDGFGAGIL